MATDSAKSQTHPLPTVFIIYFWHMRQVLNCGDIPGEGTNKRSQLSSPSWILREPTWTEFLEQMCHLKWYQEISRDDGHVCLQ